MIVPRVKHGTVEEKACGIQPQFSFSAPQEHREKACRLLTFFLPQCIIVAGGEEARITAQQTGCFHNEPEAYRLIVKDGLVRIEYTAYIGLRNALAAFSLLVRYRDGLLILPDAEIEDRPSVGHRGIMLDLARGVKSMDQLINDMILAAKARLNVLHLHLADGSGVCMQMEALPPSCWLKNAYTKEQMKDLLDLADVLALEVIPEFDMPAHSNTLLANFPEFRCDTDEPEPHSRYAICTGTPAIYDLYETIIQEIAAVFPGPYLHIGGDELDFRDVPHLGALCYWDSCAKCRAFREEHGLADRQEQYYYFIRRIHEFVKKAGRTMIMWSDQIDCAREAGLSTDILMQFWRVAAPGRGPHEGCSMNGQLAMGYTVINSYYPQVYGDEEEYMSSEKLRTWRYTTDPACDAAYEKQVRGSEACFWNYGDRSSKFGHYDYSLPSAVVLIGDKLWNNDDLDYTDTYCRGVTRTVLGAGVPDDLNVFAPIGDILPPRTEERAYVEKITCSDAEIEAVIRALSEEERYCQGDAVRAAVYADCARYTLQKRR